MDCSICSTMPFILRPPRNTICGSCYESAKTVISLMNRAESDKAVDKVNTSVSNSAPNSCKASSTSICCWYGQPQPLANLAKWMNTMKDTEEELREKINFLSGFFGLYREQILTDIQLKPGNDGPSISAHRAVMAARSQIFKNMFDSDACIAPAKDTITLPELSHEELEAFLEFLYSGNLSLDKVEKHVYSLTLAADKYEIPYLMKFCERHMLRSLDSTNALDILEISDVCSNKALKETTLNFIVRNVEDVVFSPKFESFVPKNPHLAVHISRAVLMDSKSRRLSGV
ncbi:hypothetical protein Tsubulata_047049, partial [Turnera subulata]